MLKNTHNRWRKPRKHAVDIWEHTLWCGPNRGGIYWEQLSRKYICWRMRRTLTEISWWCMLGNYWFERAFYLYPAVIHVGNETVYCFASYKMYETSAHTTPSINGLWQTAWSYIWIMSCHIMLRSKIYNEIMIHKYIFWTITSYYYINILKSVMNCYIVYAVSHEFPYRVYSGTCWW